MMTNIQIAIDGPASAGKSTIAKILASNLKYVYVDTGAMYRTITLAAKQAGISYDDEQSITELLDTTDIRFEPGTPVQHVFLNNQEVTSLIRSTEVTNNVSLVSSYAAVRENLVERQRAIASHDNVIMDGRDIGTTVLPKAQVKIFLVASVEERAQRRYRENVFKGIATDLDTLRKEIETRDYKDSHRQISPLVQAKDAILVDTTGQTIEQVVDEITEIIKNSLNL
ncbi:MULTISPECIES: (d)CMP kinase [Leuconostoc]|uniref:Cytidylate kinase n=1 Tax=Leuconostoc pseudomesenteroides TaxID=33968 RepID=A0A1X0VEM1_LEUPS|nr:MULTISPECIES: (d)CMP kinase [Leuconostoc]MCT4420194.1 (d)CMP kinase [Leuconostoc falkenbergense]MDG9744813.1 (d)CMP kinase [Leuconostoc falkenbergense]OQJ68132.1 cytidylate kinase [Leuconostoc pseudomesenteroides]OQJ71967.1 cytidylate kinase [Leuconostoc pseudomesenteroides]OQJ72071.1 cytidylate kinase [Leuconostoc pseudomesenteroides]